MIIIAPLLTVVFFTSITCMESPPVKAPAFDTELLEEIKKDNLERIIPLIQRIKEYHSYAKKMTSVKPRDGFPLFDLSARISVKNFDLFVAAIEGDRDGVIARLAEKPSQEVLICALVLASIFAHTGLISLFLEAHTDPTEALDIVSKFVDKSIATSGNAIFLALFFFRIELMPYLLNRRIDANKAVLAGSKESINTPVIVVWLQKEIIATLVKEITQAGIPANIACKLIEFILSAAEDMDYKNRIEFVDKNYLINIPLPSTPLLDKVVAFRTIDNTIAILTGSPLLLLEDQFSNYCAIEQMLIDAMAQKILSASVRETNEQQVVNFVLNNVTKIREADFINLVMKGFPADICMKKAKIVEKIVKSGSTSAAKALMIAGADKFTDFETSTIPFVQLVLENMDIANQSFGHQTNSTVAELLLKKGADLACKEPEQSRLLLKFKKASYDTITTLLCSQEGARIHIAAALGNQEDLKKALSEKPSIDELSESLEYATGQAQTAVIPTLLSAGANPLPALENLEGILLRLKKQRTIWTHEYYTHEYNKELHELYKGMRSLLVQKLSLKDRILKSQNSEVKQVLKINAVTLPDELRKKITPSIKAEVEALITRHKNSSLAALETALRFNYSHLIPTLIQRADEDVSSSILTHASKHNALTIMRYLLSHGYSPDQAGTNSLTPLMHAIIGGSTEVAELLLNSGASILWQSSVGKTALHYAIELRLTAIVAMILEVSKKTNSMYKMLQSADKEGNTPLLLACKNEDLLCAQLLLKDVNPFNKSSIVNMYNAAQQTALTVASVAGNKELVEFLLGNEASPLIIDYEGSPLFHAIKGGYNACIDLFFTHPFSISKIKELINIVPRSPYSFQAPKKRSTLMYSYFKGDVATFKRLLVHGANVNAPDEKNKTILHYTVENNDLENTMAVTKASESLPTLVNTMDKTGNTALLIACRNGYVHLAKILLDQGAHTDILDANTNNNSPLMYAVIHKDKDLAQKILEQAQTDELRQRLLNQRDAQGNSPLLLACRSGNLPMVNMLINRGADCAAHNRAKEGVLELVKLSENKALSYYIRLVMTPKASIFSPLLLAS